ncbi:MAG: PAS domain S-box protein, partial [Gemmatimonadetes bacterium]|nr:PAS domain S-box protein [Gemmatimonadota bacterium]
MFLVGLAGFWAVLIYSGAMAAGYFAMIMLVVRRGEDISLGYEAIIAALIFVLGAFAGTVLARARRHTRRLRETAAQLRKLSLAVEQSPSLLVITDTEGRIEYVNPKFTETTGYTLEEVRGETPRVLKSEETPLETHDDLWRTIVSGSEWKGELKNLKKNGDPY